MSLIGVILLFSGWAIVMAALVLLPGLGERYGFIQAGLFVQLLGLGLLARSFTLPHRTSQKNGFGGPR